MEIVILKWHNKLRSKLKIYRHNQIPQDGSWIEIEFEFEFKWFCPCGTVHNSGS